MPTQFTNTSRRTSLAFLESRESSTAILFEKANDIDGISYLKTLLLGANNLGKVLG
jgi:hypothetical protein